jgi:hypothetical protein
MVGLRVFYVFVKEGKGLDFAFRLFQDKLGKQHFDQLATMIVGRAFWLMLVVTVLSFVAWGYGLYLNRPTASQADFSLTVYVHSPGDMMRWPLVNEGEVVLRLGPDTRRAPIGNEGRAFFPALSGTFRGQEVEVKVLPETFELTDGGHAMLTPPSLSLAVRRKDFTFRGHVQESGRKGEAVKDARVEIAGVVAMTDSFGTFELTVPGDRLAKDVDVAVTAKGYKPYRATIVPGSTPPEIPLQRSTP